MFSPCSVMSVSTSATCAARRLVPAPCSLAGQFGKQTIWRPAGRGKPTEALRGYTMLQLVDIACEWDANRSVVTDDVELGLRLRQWLRLRLGSGQGQGQGLGHGHGQTSRACQEFANAGCSPTLHFCLRHRHRMPPMVARSSWRQLMGRTSYRSVQVPDRLLCLCFMRSCANRMQRCVLRRKPADLPKLIANGEHGRGFGCAVPAGLLHR